MKHLKRFNESYSEYNNSIINNDYADEMTEVSIPFNQLEINKISDLCKSFGLSLTVLTSNAINIEYKPQLNTEYYVSKLEDEWFIFIIHDDNNSEGICWKCDSLEGLLHQIKASIDLVEKPF